MGARLKPKVEETTLTREVLWTNGKYAVVAGPFPKGFVRSADAATPHKAAKRKLDSNEGTICARPATSRDDRYAKVLTSSILALSAAVNEWGQVSL